MSKINCKCVRFDDYGLCRVCGRGYQSELNNVREELDAYKIALNYFVKEGGKPAQDIVKNLLKELEG